MSVASVSPGIRRVLADARQTLDPALAEREGRAVALCAAMTAEALVSGLRTFSGDPAGAARLRCRAELLAAELGVLERLCGEGGR